MSLAATPGIDIFFGTSGSSGGQLLNVVDGWTNPAWNDDAIYDDIGLLRLQGTAPVAPIPMNTSPPFVGQETTLVGFGVTSANGGNSGVKRVGTAVIEQLDLFVIAMGPDPSSTCFGDSGGTTLVTLNGTEFVAGVHSRADCEGSSIDMRVDTYQNDIQAFTGAITADCGVDGLCAEACAEPDPDCPCAGDSFCTDACADGASDPDCDPNCSANGVCATNCAQPDVDCDCSGNGQCNALCGSDDPDCVPPECAADGQCNASCDVDPDCWRAGEAVDEEYTGYQFSNCRASAAGGPSGDKTSFPVWMLLGLGLFAMRRSRS